jgi:hypothetical protein
MKKLLSVLSVLSCSILCLSAQTDNTNIVSGGLPVMPPDFPTNQLQQVAGASVVASSVLNMLPAWNKNLPYFTNAHELELEISPTWKSSTAAGSTPYVSFGANYFITPSLGIGADVITFGNGTGTSDLDSSHFFGLFRKSSGNIAGHLILGGGRDNNRNQWDAEFGGGVEYRYSTGVGILLDTRYLLYPESKPIDHEFLTRVGLTLHF